jgi:peptidoglycan/LPS O-acetylase OafA/YrhL
MLIAIVDAVLGLALLVLAGLGIYSLRQEPADRIPLIYGAFMGGLLFLTLGVLQFVYRPRRYGHPSAVSDSGGYGGDCGHGDAGGGHSDGCGGDGGGCH